MPVMYSFMFWFSVRLGSIIVAIITLCQVSAGLITCAVWVNDLSGVSRQLDEWLNNNNLYYMQPVLINMEMNPKSFLDGLITFLVIQGITCLLLVYGAYKINLYLVYPYILVDLVRLLFVSINFVIAMTLVKENVFDLGVLIGGSVIGGFIILFLFYLWFCVVSFCQIVKEVEKIKEVPTLSNDGDFYQKQEGAVGINNGYNLPLGKPYF
uniref:Uncharacterized protein n=1 Tax=Timema poppense TaxID=170557 RepID=A0A7R9DNP8_TIMPO|nr:unnamed protein product [Timema poppensis]